MLSGARQPLHNSTGSKCDTFRGNPHFKGIFSTFPTGHEPRASITTPIYRGFKPDTSGVMYVVDPEKVVFQLSDPG